MITEVSTHVPRRGVPREPDPTTGLLTMLLRAEITLRSDADRKVLKGLLGKHLYPRVPGLDASDYAVLDDAYQVLALRRSPEVFGRTLRMQVRGALSGENVRVYLSFADDMPLCVHGLDFLYVLVRYPFPVRFCAGNLVVPVDDDLERAIDRAMRSKHVCGND